MPGSQPPFSCRPVFCRVNACRGPAHTDICASMRSPHEYSVPPSGPHLGQMISQFVPDIFGLLQPIYECRVYHVTLSAQVIGRLGQDAVHQGLQRHRVVPLLVCLLHVGIREVQPVIQAHRAEIQVYLLGRGSRDNC